MNYKENNGTKNNKIYMALPTGVLSEIKRIVSGMSIGVEKISEIRLVRGYGSSFILGGRRYRLFSRISATEMDDTFFRICSRAIYAHRDTVIDGYVTCEDGIRVGVSGTARYDGGKIVGVGDINALVFRIPTASSGFSEALYEAYKMCDRGLLIYSKAGVGKTTALRTLVSLIAKREPRENIVVVDERCEFSVGECESNGVMLLRGYDRTRGMDIALRTLTASIIVVDEISGDKSSEELSSSLLSGVKFVASAHAERLSELLVRDGVAPLVKKEIFDVFFGICYTDEGYFCEVDKKECLRL